MPDPLRILVVTNLYPSQRFPSFGTFVHARVEALRAAGADVVVAANLDGTVHDRRLSKYLALAARALLHAARQMVRRRPPHVVEAHIAYPTGIVALLVATLTGAPLVLFAHGSDVTEVSQRSARHRRVARMVLDRAALIVANSEFLAEEIRRRFPGLTTPIEIQSPGIELVRFRGGVDQRPREGLLFVGRLVPQKGLDVLIDAIAGSTPELRCMRLRVIGDGPERHRLEAQAAEAGLDVAFLGPVEPERVAAEMHTAEVVVVPSARDEALGLVAVEAMAAGAIVVASAVGGLPSVVGDGNTGFLATAGDRASLASALQRALRAARDQRASAALKASAAVAVEEHDVRRIAAASVVRYRKLVR